MKQNKYRALSEANDISIRLVTEVACTESIGDQEQQKMKPLVWPIDSIMLNKGAPN